MNQQKIVRLVTEDRSDSSNFNVNLMILLRNLTVDTVKNM